MASVKEPDRIRPSLSIPKKHLNARVSFLYQASTCLIQSEANLVSQATISRDNSIPQEILQSKTNRVDIPDCSNLSRHLAHQLKEVSLRTQIRLSPAIKSSICKRCNTILVTGSTAVTRVENTSKLGRKPWADILIISCIACGLEKRFPASAERQKQRQKRQHRNPDSSHSPVSPNWC
jgi:ribonuclease P protein subunit RPR2